MWLQLRQYFIYFFILKKKIKQINIISFKLWLESRIKKKKKRIFCNDITAKTDPQNRENELFIG